MNLINNNYLKCLIFFVFTIILDEILKTVLGLDKLLYMSMTEKFTTNQLRNILEIQENFKLLNYILIPIFFIIKTSIIATVLSIGLFFNNYEVNFGRVIGVVFNAEFIFLLIPIFKLIWFCFFQTNFTFEEVQFFYPLSALSIIGYKGIDAWFLYPLQILNLFEVFYIVYLSYQMGFLTKTNADKGLNIVGYSYLPALLLWVAIIMFFTLNYS